MKTRLQSLWTLPVERQTGVPMVRAQTLLESTFFSSIRQCQITQIIMKNFCSCISEDYSEIKLSNVSKSEIII